jgi:nicotinamide riboside transporter PnuC
MIFLFFSLTLLACSLLYLSHKHQRCLVQPLSVRPWRTIAVLILILALFCATQAFSMATAIFAWLASIMLIFSLLPFISLLLKGNSREC